MLYKASLVGKRHILIIQDYINFAIKLGEGIDARLPMR